MPRGVLVLVLEDYHVIIARQIHAALAFLLDHMPPTLHIVLITRDEPPLPLARLRARDELCELTAADLRFSLAETAAFLEQTVAFPLASEAIVQLHQHTQGWAAGLRLAALLLRGHAPQEAEQLLAAFTGRHRHVADYFAAEVLDAQPAHIQAFLLTTAFLSRLNASLCDAATDGTDSASMLRQLEQANLFITPLDETQQWYAYHPLFAEALQHEAQRRLGEDQVRSVVERASAWYEQHDMLAEAVEAALAVQSFERAATLIEHMLDAHGFDELYTLRRWAEQVPETVLRHHPTLCFNYAIAILYTSDRRAPATATLLDAPLQLAEQVWRAENNQPKIGEALAFRALVAWWQGDSVWAFAGARRALALLPEHETYWRGISLMSVGMEEVFAGDVVAAQHTLTAARALCAAASNGYAARATSIILIEACMQCGELRQAEQHARQLFAEAGDDLLDRGHGLIGFALIACERNDLAAAERNAAQAIELAEQHSDAVGRQLVEDMLVTPASLVLARVQHARGETAAARQVIETLVAQEQASNWLPLLREVQAYQALFALAAGDLAAVQHWMIACAQQHGDVPLVQHERKAMIGARLLLRQGDAATALRVLDHWRARAEAQARRRSVIEIVALTALAHAVTGDSAAATRALIEALALAQPESYRRLFLDEGPPMAALLAASRPSDALRGFHAELTRAFADAPPAAPPDDSIAHDDSVTNALAEPLSPQEQRVLRLLAAGLSNPEIAGELIVSVNTVKTQVQSIYRNLGVSSRREARAGAAAGRRAGNTRTGQDDKMTR